MKSILRYAAILAIGAVVGFVLLVAVYCIPAEWIRPQAVESQATFAWEGKSPPMHERYREVSWLDSFTDSLMLGNVAYDGTESPIEKAVLCYRYDQEPWKPYENYLALYAPDATAEDFENVQRIPYARYWHGYLVTLKPLMVFFNYEQIRTINTFVLCAMFALNILLMLRRRQTAICILPFALMAAVMFPETIVRSLQFSTVMHISLLTNAALLMWWRPGRQISSAGIWFLLSGIACGYMDFLTTPTMAVTIPMVTLLALTSQQCSYRVRLPDLIRFGFVWGVGYAGMWASKWLIVLVHEGTEFFTQVLLPTVVYRTAAPDSGMSSRLAVIAERFMACLAVPHLKMMFFVLCLFTGVMALRTAIRQKFADAGWHLLFVLVALIPFGWTFVMSNHSYEHFYTYRTFAPVLYAVPVALSTYAVRDQASMLFD